MKKLFYLSLVVLMVGAMMSFDSEINKPSSAGLFIDVPAHLTMSNEIFTLEQTSLATQQMLNAQYTEQFMSSTCYCTTFDWGTLMYERQYFSGQYYSGSQRWCFSCPAPPQAPDTEECISGCGY